MFFIPGELISLITFPGIIVHEMAHRFFCDITHTPVYAISYFNLGNPTGFVYHAPCIGIKKNLLIALGPLIINSILCMIIGFYAAYPLIILETHNNGIFSFFMLWLAVSIGIHAFPSDTDIKSLRQSLIAPQESSWLLRTTIISIQGFFKVINYLRIVWIDFIYASILINLLPILLMR